MALDPAETRKFKTKMQADLVAGKDSFPDLQKAAFSLVNGSTKLSSRTNQHLRHVEKDILIPKIMREKAKERCSEQVQGTYLFIKIYLKIWSAEMNIDVLFYQVLQELWSSYGSKMPERKLCIERMSDCLL
ncbi:COX assembly mitochondrial protein homolog isoform X2 [Papio anubis]|uniref:COX assembly mitochondrial protein homolog isoform X2 n=1 Tax=Papio anubis TaxID=9555 RepID=UPI000B7B8C75|nr:COX assembly mitochondrial protein homolog isoform X2 [Papio anubis]